MWKVIRTTLLASPLPAFPAWLTYESTAEVFPLVVGAVEIPIARIMLTIIFYLSLFYAMFRSIERLDRQYDGAGIETPKLNDHIASLTAENTALRQKSDRLDGVERSIAAFQSKLIEAGRVDLAIQLGFHISTPQTDLRKDISL